MMENPAIDGVALGAETRGLSMVLVAEQLTPRTVPEAARSAG
jgi:hypothetical protein